MYPKRKYPSCPRVPFPGYQPSSIPPTPSHHLIAATLFVHNAPRLRGTRHPQRSSQHRPFPQLYPTPTPRRHARIYRTSNPNPSHPRLLPFNTRPLKNLLVHGGPHLRVTRLCFLPQRPFLEKRLSSPSPARRIRCRHWWRLLLLPLLLLMLLSREGSVLILRRLSKA